MNRLCDSTNPRCVCTTSQDGLGGPSYRISSPAVLASGGPTQRLRALFVCGSRNQTTQLHQIANHLSDFDQYFSPFFVDGIYELARECGWLDFTIAGGHWREECLQYLHQHSLPIDVRGEAHHYDLIVTCQDLFVPKTLRGKRCVLVQEGMVDSPNLFLPLVRRFRWLPRWLASTAATGLSHQYDRFCVASEGFRELFVRRGVHPEKMVVTGLPNFSDCLSYCRSDFPQSGFLLICTSDSRETFKLHNRRAFLRRARSLAEGRRVIVKLHPNERFARAIAEIKEEIPDAEVFTSGSAENMIAKCDILVTEWSSTALVGLALAKQVHSSFRLDELRTLVPLQTEFAAENIAAVCRTVALGQALEVAQPMGELSRSTRMLHPQSTDVAIGVTT